MTIILLILTLLAVPAYADEGLYGYGAIGQSRFSQTTPDGAWHQDAIGVTDTEQSLAWQAGLGYGWSNWAVEAGYIDIGRVSSGGLAVGDADYYPEKHDYNHQAHVVRFNATDSLQAGAVKVKYNFDGMLGFRPFLEAGIWVGGHAVSLWTDHGKGNVTHSTFSGMLAGPVVGGGLCYDVLGMASVCGQVEYYKSMTQSGFPISTEVVMPSAVLKVPLVWH